MGYRTVNLQADTFSDFRNLKKTVAETMTDDEFLRVLMTVYRTQREIIKAKSK